MPDTGERFAIAVVRAWIEPGDHDTLKVRITRLPDDGANSAIGVASDVDRAVDIVRRWLVAFATEPRNSDPA